ncbi:uncharacterized protein LOC117827387 [Xyrichtys novacula]|uniref:Uncharacterized protein LOC117827387 n=1 Tax=Xyrichtys novacula TaxID=13765 RepID=A0AAV1GF85_XYRNO|nr:uncharacterized protein LOC117827387 [Xyrichtys novacula]
MHKARVRCAFICYFVCVSLSLSHTHTHTHGFTICLSLIISPPPPPPLPLPPPPPRSELKQELDEEGSRCLLLSRQGFFNQRCCIRCCAPFTFLLNPKRKCRDCRYNVCKACRVYSKREKSWLCSACEKGRLLKTQNLEWFYTNVKTRFKRFGSAKVLKTLYRKHLVEHRSLSELSDGSTFEDSICNEGSICGSDSAFYRQSEEHSMEETLTVALRVAEEAIDEAITKAEFDTNQEKQNEAHYLREHKGELVEELAKTIVQKIINRRKTLADRRGEYDQDWPVEHNPDLHHHHQSTSDHAASSVKQQPGLFRSHSAYSLLENESPGSTEDSSKASVKEGGGSAMSTWKSVDRLDNAGVSAVLHSMDGNWIALQSAQLSRPSLLTQRKSQVYSALERESAVVSAYEGMGSDNELRPELDSSVGAALQEIHRKMMEANINLQDTCDRMLSPIIKRRGSRDRVLSPMVGRRNSRDSLLSDSEGNWKPNKPLLGVIKMKVPAEIRRPSSRRTSIIDVNFNMDGASQEEKKGAAEADVHRVERLQKKKKIEQEFSSLDNSIKDNYPSDSVTSDAGETSPPEPLGLDNDITGQIVNQIDQELALKLEQLVSRANDPSAGGEKEAADGVRDAGDDEPTEEKKEEKEEEDDDSEQLQSMEIESDGGGTEDEEKEEENKEEYDEEMNYRLSKLITKSRLSYFSSTEDELDTVGKSEEEEEREEKEEEGEEGEGQEEGEAEGDKDEEMKEELNEQREEETNGFTYKLCQLEKEVRANQFSSTEDEMDRVGVEEKTGEEEEEEDKEENVELAVKVCRLAYQVNANQFSSTEDELDSVGLLDEDMKAVEEGVEDEKTEDLALKVCRLAHQVNASQFSSTEDELDRVGRGEEEEGTDEEALWKEQAERAVQAAHLRDLSSLVGPSEFSSSEDNLEKVGETGQDVVEVNESGEWGDAEENNQDKEESFEDLDVNMFDLRDEIEGRKTECSDEELTCDDVMVEEKKDVVEECEVFIEADQAEETEERQGMEERADEGPEETTEVQEEKQPEGQEDKNGESNGSVESWETADEEERNEEYAEFDRIISSMLMMTLEDMQVQTSKDEAEQNGEVIREPEEVEVDEKPGGERETNYMEVKTEGEGALEQVKEDEVVETGGERGLEQVQVEVEEVKIVEESVERVKVEEEEKVGESGLEETKVEEEVKEGGEVGLEQVEVEEVKVEEISELKPVNEDETVKIGEESVRQEKVDEEVKRGVVGLEQVKVDEKENIEEESKSEEMKVEEEVKIGRESESEEEKVKVEEESGLEQVKVDEKVKVWGDIRSEHVDVEVKVKTGRNSVEQVKVDEKVKAWEETGYERVNEDVTVKTGRKSVEHVKVDEEVKEGKGSGLERRKVDKEVKLWEKIGSQHEEVKLWAKFGLQHVKVDEEVKVEEKSKVKEQVVDAQSSHESRKLFQSPSNNLTPAVKESPKMIILSKEESADAAVRKQNETQKKTADSQVTSSPAKKSTVMSIKEMLETFEAKQLCKRIGLQDDKQEDRGGKVSAMRQMMEAHGDAAETKGRMEETRGRKSDSREHSRRSSLHDVLETPEEIAMDSDMEIYKTVEFISTLLEQRYSAVSLRNITTEVLKVLNTTEDLLQGVKGGEKPRSSIPSLPPNTDPRKLDQQFSKLEENVYVAAGSVYNLEAELSDLEECARGISGETSDMEISFLEEQVASAAAKVQQSDLQICDISARIAALKNAGLNVDTQSRPPKARTIPVMPVTLDSSRQFRRRLPAPPVKDKET